MATARPHAGLGLRTDKTTEKGALPTASELWSSFRTWPRTFGLVYRASPASTLALVGMTFASALVPVGIAWVGKRVVDAVYAKDAHGTFRWVLTELALVVIVALVGRAQGLVRSLLGARLAVDVNVAILEKALALPLPAFEDATIYDLMTKARREASSRPVGTVTDAFAIGQNVLSFLGYAAVLFGYGWPVVVALVIAAIPPTIAELKFSTSAFRLRNWRAPEGRRLNYLEYVLTNDTHAKEVKLFGIGPTLLGRFRDLGERLYREDKTLAIQRTAWGYGLSLSATVVLYGCYVAIASSAARGLVGIGAMTLYMASLRQGQQALGAVLGGVSGMYENNLYMTNLFSFFALGNDAVATIGDPEPGGEGLVLEDVGFRYPGRDAFTLQHVNLAIPKGKSLAIVGHNGAGKTTLIKLLTGLYEPTEGRVLLDGKDLRSYDPATLRKRLAVVFQDFNKYQFTVRENVGVGDVEQMGQDDRVRAAIELGGAKEVVDALPDGLESQLGGWFSKGAEVSGGQWQKIALSRAFMRTGADVLILDEPTSALDAEAEHAVFRRFAELTKGRTSVLVSHRFPTVRMADRIVVIEGGTVLEEGTHDELVAKDGRYARLFRLQAEGYS